MLKLEQHLVQMLNDNHYVVSYEPGSITIESSSGKQQLNGLTAPLISIFAFMIGLHPMLIALGALLVLVPVLYDRWRFPKRIIFGFQEEFITIKKGIILSNALPFREVLDLYGEKNELWSDVSAFQEGNKDFIYKVFVSTKTGKVHKLLRLQFRAERDGQISQLTRYLKNLKPIK